MTQLIITTLGESCDMYQPKTISKKEMIEDGKYPVFGANGIIGRYNQYNHEERELLLTCRGATCGALNVSEPYSWINGNAMVIKPKTKDINFNYLRYFLEGGIDLKHAITGAAQPQITRQNLIPISLPVPPLTIQKQIVEKLDAAFTDIDKAISATEKNIENAEALFQSLLNNQFNSKENLLSLKEVAELDKKQGKYMDLPYIGMEDIESGTGKFLGDLSNKEMKSNTFKFNSDHLLYGRLRPYLNKVMLPDFEGHCSTEIFPILVKESIKKEYLFYWLISEETVKQINRTSTGARMPRANYKAIKEIKLNVPDINSQMEIVKKIKAIELKLRNYKHLNTKKISEFNLLKSSILNQAFSGELTKDAA
tara:strand:+ start:1720 stop:2820 length:1101 start_codon:yes stop_codon:yes gene_type:complete